jgi:hypothetical protein
MARIVAALPTLRQARGQGLATGKLAAFRAPESSRGNGVGSGNQRPARQHTRASGRAGSGDSRSALRRPTPNTDTCSAQISDLGSARASDLSSARVSHPADSLTEGLRFALRPLRRQRSGTRSPATEIGRGPETRALHGNGLYEPTPGCAILRRGSRRPPAVRRGRGPSVGPARRAGRSVREDDLS